MSVPAGDAATGKIPVLAAIRDGYRFVGTHLGAIIGMIWVPMVVVTVTGFFATQRFYAAQVMAGNAGNPALAGPAFLLLLLQMAGSIFLYAMMYTAVTQAALGSRDAQAGPVAFGRTEWRMTRALMGMFVLAITFLMGIDLGLAGLLLALGKVAAPMQALAVNLVALPLLAALIYVFVRLFFFLPIAVVAGDGAPLARAWNMGRGQFWRMLGVLAGALGPLLVLYALGLALLLAGSGTPPADEAALLARVQAALPLIKGLGFLVAPLILGLFCGASASAWRAITRRGVEIVA